MVLFILFTLLSLNFRKLQFAPSLYYNSAVSKLVRRFSYLSLLVPNVGLFAKEVQTLVFEKLNFYPYKSHHFYLLTFMKIIFCKPNVIRKFLNFLVEIFTMKILVGSLARQGPKVGVVVFKFSFD